MLLISASDQVLFVLPFMRLITFLISAFLSCSIMMARYWVLLICPTTKSEELQRHESYSTTPQNVKALISLFNTLSDILLLSRSLHASIDPRPTFAPSEICPTSPKWHRKPLRAHMPSQPLSNTPPLTKLNRRHGGHGSSASIS